MICSHFIQLVLGWGKTVMCLVRICVTTILPLLRAKFDKCTLSAYTFKERSPQSGQGSLQQMANLAAVAGFILRRGFVTEMSLFVDMVSYPTGKTLQVYILM